jgi:sugar lactone lactonase YvrE
MEIGMTASAETQFVPLISRQFTLGESPVYDKGRNALWFCDILEGGIHRVMLGDRTLASWQLPAPVGSIGLARSGRLVVALRHEVGLFDPDNGRYERLVAIEAGRDDTRLNDGKVGPDGCFWVGSMDDRGKPVSEPIGALYRVSPDATVERKVEGLKTSNGLAFSPDGRTMFHSDSRGPWIDRWTLDPATGSLSDRRRLAELDDARGRPDGGATDAEGYYWSAGISAQRLNRFAPDGRLVETLPLPVGAPTMPCFGGEGLRTLFVTSLRAGRSPDLLARYPLTGSVLVGPSPVAGSPVGRFADT